MKSHKMSNGSRQSFPGLQLRYLAVSVAATIGTLGAGLFAPHALAQDTTTLALDEIVVTARRTEESVQDIPVAVQAVTGEQLQELRMVDPKDIAKLAPGLSLYIPEPQSPVIVLRGVRWTAGSGTPAVPVYLNETPFDPAYALQAMYDMERVEVLRGPQGTSRGAPSISGALTLTTRRPDFDGVSGYVSGMGGENGHGNLEGAVNIPVIADKLAVRVAGTYDISEANGIHSAFPGAADPERELISPRVSVRYEPTETFSVDAMYSRIDASGDVYAQVVGTGSPGRPAIPGVGPALPANFNGPAIELDDYLGVAESPNERPYLVDFITLNANWEVLGHDLNYNFGSYENVLSDWNGESPDPANLLVGWNDFNAPIVAKNENFTHELRLSSLRDGDNAIDYDVGVYYNTVDGPIDYFNVGAIIPQGGFGNPYTANYRSPFINPGANDRYGVHSQTRIRLETENYSGYGHLTWHISDATELSGGLRWIHDERPTTVATTIAPAFLLAAPVAAFGGNCANGGPQYSPSPVYPGFCDIAQNLSALAPPDEYNSRSEITTIWNSSLSHQFNDQILGYVTIGTSWRAGLPSIANVGMPASFVFPDPEEATSYEIGVKTDLTSNLRVNANLFQIDYEGQLTQFQFMPYYNTISQGQAVTNTAFYDNVDAQVRGAEFEILALPVENLTLGLNLSYSKIESEGGEVPCADPTRPLTAANPLNYCSQEKGTELSASPKFQANLMGSYVVPFDTGFDGYFRFLANYQDENPNYAASLDEADAFVLVDLFLGIQESNGDWDLGLYGKNVFDEVTELTRNPATTGVGGVDQLFGPSGYQRVTATLPRELGLSFRYNFSAE